VQTITRTEIADHIQAAFAAGHTTRADLLAAVATSAR
jgi:hypothetical protein